MKKPPCLIKTKRPLKNINFYFRLSAALLMQAIAFRLLG